MMRSLLRTSLIMLGLLVLLPWRVVAQTEHSFSPDEVPNVQLSDSTRFVSDPSDYISEEQEWEINRSLQSLRAKYGIEFAVVVVPSIKGADIESFSTSLFRLWGLGDKEVNDGLLFVLAVEARKSRFEVGYGLEGYLTDARTGRIWRQSMRPLVQNGDYARAILSGIDAVQVVLQKENYTAGKPASRKEGVDWYVVLQLYSVVMLLVFVCVVLNLKVASSKAFRSSSEARTVLLKLDKSYSRSVIVLCIFALPLGLFTLFLRRYLLSSLRRLASECPNCKQLAMKQSSKLVLTPVQAKEVSLGSYSYLSYECGACYAVDTIGLENQLSGYKRCLSCGGKTARLISVKRYRKPSTHQIYRLENYQCMYCGNHHHQDKFDREVNQEADLLGLGAGIVLGSALSRGRGGYSGGFGGGSFGGGSSGGGGSTGSW